MSQLASAAAIWYVHCFEVIRSAGCYIDGVYRLTSSTTIAGKGNVQPMAQADVERLPEGARSDGAVTIYTRLDLRAASSPNSVADRVKFKGVEYEVATVEYWPSHNRYGCVKVGQ